MLWFMAFTSHYATRYGAIDDSSFIVVLVVFLVILAVVELAALGKIGGYDGPLAKQLFDKHKDTITAGFVVWFVLFVIGYEIIIGAS